MCVKMGFRHSAKDRHHRKTTKEIKLGNRSFHFKMDDIVLKKEGKKRQNVSPEKWCFLKGAFSPCANFRPN